MPCILKRRLHVARAPPAWRTGYPVAPLRIKIWSRVLTLGTAVLPRALRWALAWVIINGIVLAGADVDGEPQLVGLLRVLAAAGVIKQDADDASLIGPGPAWRAYAGELRGRARPCLADFVGVLLELRFLRAVECPICLCASCWQGCSDSMTLVSRLADIKDEFPDMGFATKAAILLAHGVPATYYYEVPDPEACRIHGINVLFWATVRSIFDE